MTIETLDILRKLAIGQGAVILVMAIWTIVRYARNIQVAQSNDKALPSHVVLVASSYLCFLFYVCVDTYEKLGLPLTWRLTLALIGCLLGCGALAFLIAHLSVRRYLIKRIDSEADKAVVAAAILKAAAIERRIDRMEEVGQETHDAVQEIQHDAGVAKETARDVSDKADTIGEVGADTNSRVRKLERTNGN